MDDSITVSEETCLHCKKNFRVGGKPFNEKAHLMVCSPPYFFYNWNDAKHPKKPEYCNLCYYTKLYFCCQENNSICELHQRLTEFEQLDILAKIKKDDNLKNKLSNLHQFIDEIEDTLNKK